MQRVPAVSPGRGDRLPAPKPSLILVVLDDIGVEYLDYHGIGEQYATGLSFSTIP